MQLVDLTLSTASDQSTSAEKAHVDNGQQAHVTASKRVTPPNVVEGKLHGRTVVNAPLEGKPLAILPPSESTSGIVETTELFAQHGITTPGVHFRIKNTKILNDIPMREKDSVLVLLSLNNHESWGDGRSVDDFFGLLTNFTHPHSQTSLAILTSSADEFDAIQLRMRKHIHAYAQFNLILRHDFKTKGLTRGNRHASELQEARRGMLARYRNYLLLSTLETWHQHTLWLDADVHIVPPDLLTTIIRSGRDIVEPRCNRGSPPDGGEFDYNAWVGNRQHMDSLREPQEDFVHLDSVGGTTLYVRADVHRQGVLFPHFYLVGGEWEKNGYDAIETEGLCYAAHFLGYKCWGMPHHLVYHMNG